MPRCNAKASLGKCLTPMLANKTSFETALSDITFRHRNFAAEMPDEETGADSLALKFPTFVCEVKLDGERIVTHVNRGIVTMQVLIHAIAAGSLCAHTVIELTLCVRRILVDEKFEVV